MSKPNEIMVLVESAEQKLTQMAKELLSCGRALADSMKQDLSAVIVGERANAMAAEAISLGTDRVYSISDPLAASYQADVYLKALEAVFESSTPSILLLGQTAIGRDLAPRLAFRLNTAITMDCIGIHLDPETNRILATKPVYGGNAHAVFTSEADPQIVTIRAKVMQALEPDPTRQGETVAVDPGLSSTTARTRLIEQIAEEVEGIKLEDAAAIVCGGRGLDDAESFDQLRELADLLEGAIAATRPAVDNGWLPDTLQVGLTGKIVTPDVYFAVALSGATQHMAGCSGAKTIVAINRDSHANIFKEAHYGVVGDWKTILPSLTDKIRELLRE